MLEIPNRHRLRYGGQRTQIKSGISYVFTVDLWFQYPGRQRFEKLDSGESQDCSCGKCAMDETRLCFAPYVPLLDRACAFPLLVFPTEPNSRVRFFSI